MSFATTTQGDAAVIHVPSRFDFRLMRDFDKTIEVATHHAGDEIIVDLANTAYLDSSGMAMLLVLRDRARGRGKSVVLARAGATVRGVLSIANFDRLFPFR